MTKAPILFGERFLDRHAGGIIADPTIALIELVANAWDAYATEVDIIWPDPAASRPFSITDNGIGMTPEQFELRWRMLDYDRSHAQGTKSHPPSDLLDRPPRSTFGRNGRGRHAAFYFSNPYEVRTWRDKLEVTYRVARGVDRPFECSQIDRHNGVAGHGTEVRGTTVNRISMTAGDARELIGTRFLTDPEFIVRVDGITVSFEDILDVLQEKNVSVGDLGTAKIFMIDGQRSDKTAKQHGIAWRVHNRLVGSCRWRGSDYSLILDGRTSEAKRYTFIVLADFLAKNVKSDWTDFDPQSEEWKFARPVIQEHIRQMLADVSAERRRETRENIREKLNPEVRNLSPAGRERWQKFVDDVVDNCPGIGEAEIEQVATILAKLEKSSSKYGLIAQLQSLKPGDFDNLNRLLTDWTVNTAKLALDEIQTRLQLIREMHQTLRDTKADEVQQLQPLFERSLWVFGPEFESIEYTSNQGMSSVIKKLLGKKAKGSLQRPDFVIIPDGSIGVYTCPAFGDDHEANGVKHLVIVELKKPGITIMSRQMEQARGYVVELLRKTHITADTRTTCFVLGSQLDPYEALSVTQGNNTTHAMTFETFISRAERRMLNLHRRLSDAPFLLSEGMIGDDYVSIPEPLQGSLLGQI